MPTQEKPKQNERQEWPATKLLQQVRGLREYLFSRAPWQQADSLYVGRAEYILLRKLPIQHWSLTKDEEYFEGLCVFRVDAESHLAVTYIGWDDR